ncbi:HAMP domain-containing protein [Terrilactibacillus sp. S3-3]|nr:HAMP domain-containing protein [Terrilactibacillus sp. S3-3]
MVRQIEVNTESGYLISYMWDTYTNELMQKLWSRLVFIFILAGILSLFIAFWLARYLKRPLDVLGRRFEEIARLNWEKPFEWKSGDEFERLSAQFEKMRLNLIRYDESQKIFLQQASHELKTPIMVVQSYAQSVKDHIFPKGGLNDSMDVIINEASQMGGGVQAALFYPRRFASRAAAKAVADPFWRFSLINEREALHSAAFRFNSRQRRRCAIMGGCRAVSNCIGKPDRECHALCGEKYLDDC